MLMTESDSVVLLSSALLMEVRLRRASKSNSAPASASPSAAFTNNLTVNHLQCDQSIVQALVD